MAISFVPDPVPPATRGKEFSQSVQVIAPGPVKSLSAVLQGDPDDITVSASGDSINLSGVYLAGWQDVFTYVEANESDKTDTPKTAVNIPNMPLNKNLYDLNQDKKPEIFRNYKVTVTYEDPELFEDVTAEATLVHEVKNDLEAMRKYMDEYNYNNSN